MTQTTLSEFRNNAKKYFDAVELRGETIQIYRHGKPVAILTPVTQPISRWKNRQPVVSNGIDLSCAVLNERSEAR